MPRLAVAAVAALALLGAIAGGSLALRGASAPAPGGARAATWDADDPQLGRRAYAMCQACHGRDGRGVPGFAPALAGSAWLGGDPRAAILMVLHGYDATSEPGAAYVSARMLGHGRQLADHELAGLLTWARRQWGNAAGPVSAAEVAAVRARHAGRDRPWTPAELRAIIAAP